MTHNEISALYRELLKATLEIESTVETSREESIFWDTRIYAFARRRMGQPEPRVRRAIVADIYEYTCSDMDAYKL